MHILSVIIWLLTAVFFYLSIRSTIVEISRDDSDGSSSDEEFALFGMFSRTTLFISITIILYIIQIFLLKMNIFSIIILLLTAIFAYLSIEILKLPEISKKEENPGDFIAVLFMFLAFDSIFIGITIILYIIQLFLLK